MFYCVGFFFSHAATKCGYFTETQTAPFLTAPGAGGGNLEIWGFQMMFGKKEGPEELGGEPC